MNIENKSEFRGRIPEPIKSTLSCSNEMLSKMFASERRNFTYTLTTTGSIENIQNETFVAKYLLGEMAVNEGLDLKTIFAPSKVVAMIDRNKETEFLISANAYRPLYNLDPKNAEYREDISNGCTLLFAGIQDLLLSTLPNEVTYPALHRIKDYSVDFIPKLLNQKNLKNDPKITEFGDKFKSFMLENLDEINFSIHGLELHVKLGDKKLFPIYTGNDHVIRTILAKPLIDNFIKRMKLKNRWFSPAEDFNPGMDPKSNLVEMTLALVKDCGEINNYSELFDLYVSGELGSRIISNLFIDKESIVESDDSLEVDENIVDAVDEETTLIIDKESIEESDDLLEVDENIVDAVDEETTLIIDKESIEESDQVIIEEESVIDDFDDLVTFERIKPKKNKGRWKEN